MSAGELVGLVLSVKTLADLRMELNRAHMCLNTIESFVGVAAFALRAQSSDIDADVAVVLDAAVSKGEDARTSLQVALNLLPTRGGA